MSGPHKKGGHEDGGGHAPMWIVSFADMVILLMSFFVLLLCKGAQKTSTDEDLLRILASVKVGFGYTPKPNSKDPIDIAVLQVLSEKRSGGFNYSGSHWKSPSIKGQPNKERDNWVKAQSLVGKPIRFAQNSAVIPKATIENIEQIAAIVRHHFRMVVIQGHCTESEAERDPENGHDLAYHRALAVCAALRNHGVAATRLRVVSCSSYEPLKNLNSTDRQLAVVTLGSYFLPTDNDVIEDKTLNTKDEVKSPQKSGH